MSIDTQNQPFNSQINAVKKLTGNITRILNQPIYTSRTLVHPCVIDGKNALVYEHGLNERDNVSFQKLKEYASRNGLFLKEDQRRGKRSIKNDRTTKLIPLVFLGASMFSSYSYAKDHDYNQPAINTLPDNDTRIVSSHEDAITAKYDNHDQLMAGLLGWINDHTTYQYEVDSLPNIKFSSTEEIAMVAFGKNLPKALDLKTLSIKGLYNYKEGTVYLLDSIDIESEKGRAILLHELVHFLQYEHGQEKETQCKNELEALAYLLEAKYLEEQNMKVGFSMDHVHRVSQCK